MFNRTKYILNAFPKSPSKVMAWIQLSSGILPLLIGGVIWALINITASSGAILVGCSIVSQALLQIWPLVGWVGGRKSRAQIIIEELNPGTQGIQAYSGRDIFKAFEKLKIIALDQELNFKRPKKGPDWLMRLTISRVYFSLEWCIVICAIFGTALWAYGP